MSEKYKTNFITKVVFRLDFPENIAIGSLDSFANEIKHIFPIKEEREGQTGFVELNFNSGEVNHATEKMSSWMFQNENRTKRLVVNMKFMVLEYGVYNDFNELTQDISDVIIRFLFSFNVKIISRIQLQFINEIKLQEADQLDWTKYINKNLISSLDFCKENKKKLARSMGQLVIKEEYGDLGFAYGIWNSEYPNEVNRKEFVLDFNCVSKLGISDSDVAKRAKAFHTYIEDLFEASITDDFRALLNK